MTQYGPSAAALRERLLSLAEPEFQRFSSALIPNIPPDTLLGVRLPALRKIARELAQGDWRAYLASARCDTFEEVMLQGMVLGLIRPPLTEYLSLIAGFLPKIDNWSVCDSFVSGLKIAREEPQALWDFTLPLLSDPREYVARFGVVMLLTHYIDSGHIDQLFPLLNRVRCPAFYTQMAVAWAVSLCYREFPEENAPLSAKELPPGRNS